MTIGVAILGSTGSIGHSTLDVVARHPDRFHVVALTARRNVEMIFDQCVRFLPETVAMLDETSAEILSGRLRKAGLETEVKAGEGGILDIASGPAETVVNGIVGAAGLMPVISAVEAGKRQLIANKEPLVMLGTYIVDLAREHGALLLPLDSEHNAIFQCLPVAETLEKEGSPRIRGEMGVRKIILTGSGGPLRAFPLDKMHTVDPEQAVAHPNWEMGKKISVDSATMMNKGLELIEVCCLFGVGHDLVEIVVHPQSIIHSMVEYLDGSVIAQLGMPDMRIPIANALGWPERIESGLEGPTFSEIGALEFEPPDPVRFPALRLAREAARRGGTAPSVLNAANEVAVNAFLDGKLRFDRLVPMVESALEQVSIEDAVDLQRSLDADRRARACCREMLADGSLRGRAD
ncbi:MAG: 1-deoxy-D-xylulose-5-phosphate reductoisomerase [Gammaproteobacteria bacterium]|nr:1-deoxy-D-xylulose-5-phosphate reductoisomerase [Gammaproteobacteria bacterium]MYD75781.1 1-deoxy-D-xylulose-5-phosphate reductoisomerase [Gammaproteobacteria bacterium]MYJ52596.1 1-deoxy-D-xylulose-5-phosphate reductoisomerase [Gammaproteobacteria bacterium]